MSLLVLAVLACGGSPPDDAQGGALPPAVEAPDPCADHRAHVLDRPVVAEEDFEGNVLSALRCGTAKLALANAGNPRGLPTRARFDLVHDPAELHPTGGGEELEQGLARVVQAAAATAPQPSAAATDDQDRAMLEVLGYAE